MDILWGIKNVMEGRNVKVEWVKGHYSIKHNEICDHLAHSLLNQLMKDNL